MQHALIIMLLFCCLLGILFLYGRMWFSKNFKKDYLNLLSNAGSSPNRTFNYGQLNGLPAPVQRYFKHVLKEGQPYISFVSLTHDGKFKTGIHKKWVSIVGTEYFTTAQPGFLWRGETSYFTAFDSYISGKGRLIVSLLSIFKIVDGYGDKFDQGELLRWLAESVWFPTNLLPSDHLTWELINDHQARLLFIYNELSVFYLVTFDHNDEIVHLETKRFMGEGDLETWIGTLSDYKVINGVMVPYHIKATWQLNTGTLTYADFRLRSLTYKY